jgi:hypothetical protein
MVLYRDKKVVGVFVRCRYCQQLYLLDAEKKLRLVQIRLNVEPWYA